VTVPAAITTLSGRADEARPSSTPESASVATLRVSGSELPPRPAPTAEAVLGRSQHRADRTSSSALAALDLRPDPAKPDPVEEPSESRRGRRRGSDRGRRLVSAAVPAHGRGVLDLFGAERAGLHASRIPPNRCRNVRRAARAA